MIDRIDENTVVLIVASPNPKWQNHPNCFFAGVIYTFFENKGTEDYKEVLFGWRRQNRTSFSDGRKPIFGSRPKKGDGTRFKNLGMEINFPTPLEFPNCFHITLGKSKFPLIPLGKCYTSFLDILVKYLSNFNELHFSSCTIHRH
jgi:hypothetical protein